MASNLIGTIYDDNSNPVASTKQGRTATGLGSTYGALVVAGPADAADGAAAANLVATAPEVYNGATFDRIVGKNGVQVTSHGGTTTAAITVAQGAAVPVKAAPGRLCKVLVTTAASTGVLTIYDNASAASGTVLAVVPASTAAGTVYDLQMPAAAGITVAAPAACAAVTLSYI